MVQRETFRFQTRVRFIDTDASGRIHYTAMFRYFEIAEIEFLRTVGITYALDSGYVFPRVHVECDFKATLIHDDVIDIEVRLTRLVRSSARFEFRTLKGEQVAAIGVIVIACIDSHSQTSMPIPDHLRSQIMPLLDQEEAS